MAMFFHNKSCNALILSLETHDATILHNRGIASQTHHRRSCETADLRMRHSHVFSCVRVDFYRKLSLFWYTAGNTDACHLHEMEGHPTGPSFSCTRSVCTTSFARRLQGQRAHAPHARTFDCWRVSFSPVRVAHRCAGIHRSVSDEGW